MPELNSCTFVYPNSSIMNKYVHNTILFKDPLSTPESIQRFFYFTEGTEKHWRIHYLYSGCKPSWRWSSETSPQFNPTLFNPAKIIDKYPDDMINLYSLRTGDGKQLFKNLHEFIDYARFIDGDDFKVIHRIDNYIKQLKENQFSGFMKSRLDFISKISEFTPPNDRKTSIKEMLKRKIPENPLYLQAAWDHNGALGKAMEQRIRSEDDLCKSLKEHKKLTNKPIDYLAIGAHGNPTSIGLTDDYALEKSNIKKIAPCIDETLSVNAPIFLTACSTGVNIAPEKNFAQTLALESGRNVYAATKDLAPEDCNIIFKGAEMQFSCIDRLQGEYIRNFGSKEPEI